MAYMGNLKAGDRVRVTFEADVVDATSFGVDLSVGNGRVTIREESFGSVEFEKVEPPVEVFKPGDVVRQKHGPRGVYFIRPNGGFTNLSQTGEEWDHKFEFTSEFYERVDLE